MKKHKIFSILLPVLAAFAVSCVGGKELPPIVYPGGVDKIGTGTWDDPMTVPQASTGATIPGRSEAWVNGYIVGWIDTDNGNAIMLNADANASATNMVLAASPDATLADKDYMVSVQLPSGGIRDALNLQSNPDNLGKEVTLKGELGVKYCGIYGIKTTSAFEYGPKGTYEEPIGDGSPVAQLWENFDSNSSISYYTDRYWKVFNEQGTLSGWYIKNYSGQNYATVSAYQGDANGGPYVNWLITPAIDMDAMETKTLTFKTQVGYYISTSDLEVYVLSGSNDPTVAELTKLDAAIAKGSGNPYTSWVESGDIDLSEFTGTVYIGWRYYSEKGGSDNSATYCLDNVNIGDAPEVEAPKKQYVFEQATTVVSGEKYLIVGDGTKAAVCMTANYGWLSVSDVTVEEGQMMMPSMEAAYTLTETDKGWTLTTSKGKKLGIQDGYETLVTNNDETIYWNIVPGADGAFIISNDCLPGKTATLGYSAQYGSFGAYKSAGKGTNPTLWKFVGEVIQ